MASARINLPSASVLLTSTVFPLIEVQIESGVCASDETLLSVNGKTQQTLTFKSNSIIPFIAEAHIAAPDISYFIPLICGDPFRL